MRNPFNDVPCDPDTAILAEEQITVSGHQALRQVWFWEGIYGESIVFVASDVWPLQPEELVDIVAAEAFARPDSDFTTTQGDAFVFVSYNFIEAE